MRQVGVLALAGACLLVGGCTTEEVMLAHAVKLDPVSQPVPENQLLDVGVVVFDPGVPEGQVDPEVKEQLIRDGTFVEVRRAESMYMAVQLRNTLQRSGHWGSVWVTPQDTTAADVNVTAKILQSDGDIVKVHVDAVDATGRTWIDDDYELETAEGAYNRQRYPELDPYQDLFNSIANDLAAEQDRLAGEQTDKIREVASLRYAEDLSPDAFDGYVAEEKDGRYELSRLPAVDDPMFDRTQRVRQRELLFMDTLNEHYTKFSSDAQDSYDGWRQYAREEAISIRELQKSARWRTGLGIASILASVVYGTSSGHDSFSDRVLRDALMYMGTDVLKSAAVRRQEKRLHTDTLEELSSSFNDEVQPLVVAVQGTEHRLTGTAEAQYQEWRDLLRQMFITETGFQPEDLQVYEEPETPVDTGVDAGSAAEQETGSADAAAAAEGTAPGQDVASADGAATAEPAAAPAEAAGSGDPSEAAAGGSEPSDAAPGADATSPGASGAAAESAAGAASSAGAQSATGGAQSTAGAQSAAGKAAPGGGPASAGVTADAQGGTASGA